MDRSVFPGLPGTLAFPESGDLRWRPAAGPRLHEEDLYLSLAPLVDGDGNHYGDGIAYVEHRASKPLGGKNLYAWMGMFRGASREEILYSLFKLAGERAGKR